ncbi:DMT family transporter [Ancylobacter dichloromethanicus]|uniref:ABC transporter permease n=1 Tax=Ancylobacter dichloromethanicus TaxID=518825 RepID=A0A9W6JAX3_9HYPH|nr:DMT family transporter [Ancylobacter dichloromethanicus]MBS7553261.1 DMT family transporter [Ancylobacter dichloromethanicus]GLK73041.1 ABC transporter permease [Ancylobacter dichloromethanicus]
MTASSPVHRTGLATSLAGPLPMAPSDWGALALLGLIWGGSFFFGKVAIAEIPPLTMVLTRVAIGALALWVIARARGVHLPLNRRLMAEFMVLAVIANIIPFGLIAWSQQHLPSGLSSILNAATPLFTVLVAQAFTHDEKFTVGKLVGVSLGFLGVAVMMGPALLGQLGGHQLPAQLAAIGATVSYGFAAVYSRRFRHLPPLGIAMAQLASSSLLLLPAVALIDRPWLLPAPSLPVIGALLGLGVLSTGLAYILYFRIVGRNGATNISLVTFLVPVSAILLGALVLDEALEPREFAGFAIIALGLAAIDGRPARWVRGKMG